MNTLKADLIFAITGTILGFALPYLAIVFVQWEWVWFADMYAGGRSLYLGVAVSLSGLFFAGVKEYTKHIKKRADHERRCRSGSW